MKVKLLVATTDAEYAGLISNNISEHHASVIDISVCSTLECLRDTLKKQKFDVALIDATLAAATEISSIHLPLLLWSEGEDSTDEVPQELGKVNKYQRISSIVATILERYAPVSARRHDSGLKNANITAVWSPAGGVGKTTVALAYALSKISTDSMPRDSLTQNKEVFYLNLENFSSIPGFLNKTGKSISTVFEMLDSPDGNIEILIQGICCRDKGIMYLNKPDNYDDMNILTGGNVRELVSSCSTLADELVIDLSCACDTRTESVFDAADRIFIITEQSALAGVKLMQFISQNGIFERIKEKIVYIANKGAVAAGLHTDTLVSLPFIKTDDTAVITGMLAESFRNLSFPESVKKHF